MSDRLERAIRKWAEITDAFLAEWAVKQWIKVLSERTEPTEKVLDVMAYLVSRKERPTLSGIIRYLENGLPREWTDRQEMFTKSTEGSKYFGMIFEALGKYNHWQALLECIPYGQKHAPNANWGPCIRECEENASRLNRKMPVRGD